MEQPSLFRDIQTAVDQVSVRFVPNFAGWQAAARQQWRAGIRPEAIWWAPDAAAAPAGDGRGESPRVPRSFVTQAQAAACHRSADRWALLYRLLWRLTHGERHLMQLAGDADVARLRRDAKAVRRDVHKMKAFVRFRAVAEPGFDEPRYVAWFEPEHDIVEYAAGFFQRRFANMRWSILTPDRCAHWEGSGQVRFSPGVDKSVAPTGDVTEDAWQVYYRSIFNPARLKPKAMRSEMPVKYWRNLPEARLIPGLIANADRRVAAMEDERRTVDALQCGPRPASPEAEQARRALDAGPDSLDGLAMRAALCRECALCGPATQTVFGEGPSDARIMLVGEQPGDAEDLAGRPFVGPAGELLNAALADAGLDRSRLYLTNTVKHFKFTPKGKARLHAKPDYHEVRACRPWLVAEIEHIAPAVVVALGRTAASSLLQQRVSVGRSRGRRIDWHGRCAVVTVHPAFILRSRDRRPSEYRRFVADLACAAAI